MIFVNYSLAFFFIFGLILPSQQNEAGQKSGDPESRGALCLPSCAECKHGVRHCCGLGTCRMYNQFKEPALYDKGYCRPKKSVGDVCDKDWQHDPYNPWNARNAPAEGPPAKAPPPPHRK